MFKKKKKKEEEGSSPGPEEKDKDNSESQGEAGADAGANIGTLMADVSKIKAQLESFKEIRKANAERFSTINEQIGEIRGQLMDTNRNMGELEVKTTKAADLVESVHPDKLMIQVQKSDGKVEALRGLIESKDAMIENIMEQLKTMRNQMKVFKGIEEVLKMNEQVKTEVMNMKKLSAKVEQHADRVENVFVESQKTFKEFNELIGQVSVLKSQIKDVAGKADKLEVKQSKFLETKKFEKRMNEIDKLGKRMKDLADDAEKKLKSLDSGFVELKGELKGAFDQRIERAETLSNAFAKILEENPMFAKGLDLGKYLQLEMGGEGSQANPEAGAAESASGQGEGAAEGVAGSSDKGHTESGDTGETPKEKS